MSTIVSVIAGMKEFFDEELVMKLSGLGKWIVGAGISMYMDNAVNTFNELKENPLIKGLGIIHEDDTIDIDTLYAKMKEQAQIHGAVTFNMPMIGAMTFRPEDLDHLYMDIKKH
ncbi:hypothetical protein [Treponema sp.]|uniref:hypothetical protein n=1 Tax=Treponema sp. TaxID=166 RepID=UPI00298DFF17|nr:hypothetical protein [Treponema sp.]MCQ2242122.1 hypothetical protein [Treponema sp.]